MGKAKAAPAASTDGTAKLAGTAYHAASRSVAAREQALQAAGRLCDNGEKWAKRIGARQSPYEFIELWWSLPAATRACPPPQSNGEKCRRCKKVVRLARRQFIKRDEGSRLGREVRVVKCDGGCMGQGVSVIVNKWADYGYEAEEEEEDDDGGRRALRRRSRRRARGSCWTSARRRRARAYDDDAWDKPARARAAPAPREAPPPQQPPSMDAFPSLGGGSPRTVDARRPSRRVGAGLRAEEPWDPAYAAEEPAYAAEEPWEPAYAPEEPAYAAEAPWEPAYAPVEPAYAPKRRGSDPWAPEPQNCSPRHFSPEPEVPAPEVRAVRAPARASARELKALPPGLRAAAAGFAPLMLDAEPNSFILSELKKIGHLGSTPKCRLVCSEKFSAEAQASAPARQEHKRAATSKPRPPPPRAPPPPLAPPAAAGTAAPPGRAPPPPPVASPFEQLATFLEAFGLQRHVRRFAEEEILSLRDLPHLDARRPRRHGPVLRGGGHAVSAARSVAALGPFSFRASGS
ncbi:hypothetical protein SO694_00032319 [Aureococcus anophagefferens]|uniref:SAM domain-containing protein n=1 Tax=Aureococcus anophagefferens TaxID=44056 RepID=A0ABR1FKD0_AURAN